MSWDSSENALWTLAMVGPDSQLQGEGEVLHWLVSNIPSNKVEDGQTLAPYLQPHPPFGTGYHRCELLLTGPVVSSCESHKLYESYQRLFPTLQSCITNYVPSVIDGPLHIF